LGLGCCPVRRYPFLLRKAAGEGVVEVGREES